MENDLNFDALVIGAGPSGAAAASILAKNNINVGVLEKTQFPRFSIGESLLPQCMVDLEKAGFLDAVKSHGFQLKDGANFLFQDTRTSFNFSEKFSEGPSTTFQVKRSSFDKILADTAEKNGANILYKHEVLETDFEDKTHVHLKIKDLETNTIKNISTKFILDASGFGRVLPRLLNLSSPSNFPNRQSIFCHVKDNFTDEGFERKKILITVHDTNPDIWFWVIAFSDGTSSIGVVGEKKFFDEIPGSEQDKLKHMIRGSKNLDILLKNADYITECKQISGYSANVKSLYGDRYALLGNAGEFLDPVFSSGVTIALRSATLAAPLVARQLKGEVVNWETEFAAPLQKGVDTFKAYVSSWYSGELQKIILTPKPDSKIKRMVCSILAGYTWDDTNPIAKHPARRLNAIAELISN